jgi:gliding motility-associated protein GldE
LETEPYPVILNEILLNSFNINQVIGIIFMLILIFFSAVISGSEVAFFSLTPKTIQDIRKEKSDNSHRIMHLLSNPEKLLATILISNNLVNVGIVILSSYLTNLIFNFEGSPIFEMIFKVIVITFILLLFGEIIPKVYATRFELKFAKFMSLPLTILEKIFTPLSSILIGSTSIIKNSIKNKNNISIDELSEALDLAKDDELKEDEKILKGIVNFGSITTSQIMKPRVDVVAIDIKENFKSVMKLIVESGFSRIPVFDKTFDDIKGILYANDLLPHIHKNSFRWQSLIRPPYYVPETKKINDLLSEFQSKKIHMAIVIDEYGGSAGIITLEDVLEEIVGEITDEFDEDEKLYKRLSDTEIEFDAKILLQDFYKVMGIDDNYFEENKGEADTLAGLILEIRGEIPEVNEITTYNDFEFKIVEVDNRRIKKILCKIIKNED